MQFKAGYIVDSIATIITDYKSQLNSKDKKEEEKLLQIDGLLKHVSSFDVNFPYHHQPDYTNLNPVLATINNIITRGLPTLAPVELEKIFVEIGLVEDNKEVYEFVFSETKKKIDFELIFELLHIVEPHLEISKGQYGGDPGSKSEWNFLDKKLGKYPFVKQILQSQRDFTTIHKKMAGGRTVDFSYEFPYHSPPSDSLEDNKKQGLIFEFDGPHHSLKTVRYYDKYRDEVAALEGFETLRQSYAEVGLNRNIDKEFNAPLFKIFKANYNRNIDEYLKEYSLIFIPLAVARIQKTIIEFFLANPDILEKERIEIAIIERDLPCGAIAVKLLKDMINNINQLLEEEDKLILPQISLTIFENNKWRIDKRLHLEAFIEDEEFFKLNYFDIVIDHSILRRSKIYNEIDFQYDGAIKIRSSHYFDTSAGRKVYCADLLHYHSLVNKIDDGSYIPKPEYKEHINYFIQNIFRKVGFRDGQLPIISRALQQKPVIGLLPTGGGKSLTFQLPTFMQPGLCLVVDPIKSLMEDQVRVLKENWIDCCDFINSNDKRERKWKKQIDFRYGETQFFFVSPERFVMEEFRSIINNIDQSSLGLAFSYCVIDEVHCVSEWGHDFRSTYLMIGKNAQRFATTKSKQPISLIGLTATASFDVLADIERELQIKHDDVANAIIMIENTIRPELFFRVIDVTDKSRIDELNKDFENAGKNLAKINTEELLYRSQKHHFDNFSKKDFANKPTKNLLDENMMEFEYDSKYLIKEPLENWTQNDIYSVIFCPVKGKKGSPLGVDLVRSHLKSDSVGFYYSNDEDDKKLDKEIQEHFKNFTTDKTKHIVCTKAFGMGIDKKDIRSTYHYAYSSSLESLVQEAGRSGRDKKISEANILLSTKQYVKFDIFEFFRTYSQHKSLANKFTRKALRETFDKKFIDKKPVSIKFNNRTELVESIKKTDFSLISRQGNRYYRLPKNDISQLQELMLEQKDNKYRFFIEKYEDREIHDFFFDIGFKGIDSEKSQLRNLFEIPEFKFRNNKFIFIDGQDSLMSEFENCDEEYFPFTITKTKKDNKASERICNWLGKNPNSKEEYSKKKFKQIVDEQIRYSNDFQDFLFLLEEKNMIDSLSNLTIETKNNLFLTYNGDRSSANETGRLIYRMHSIGFLTDYIIDYNKKINICTFKKYATIEGYIEKTESYLRRYLSEQTTIEKIKDLRKRLKYGSLIDDILECLYFLAEFAYNEIAKKRKRATDEIEDILNKSVTVEKYSKDWFEQNCYIKEQIYFYFNAKYARKDFKIEGEPFSLLDDYEALIKNENSTSQTKDDVLYKYLKVFHLDGTEQNNYKHMMGSCKKILRSLSESDLNNEWVLRLLKAFSMYAVNNESYVSEANEELEAGFIKLYEDVNFHGNDYHIIEPIFRTYFDKLEDNIEPTNQSFEDIKLIRVKILIQLQAIGLETILKNNKLIAANYA